MDDDTKKALANPGRVVATEKNHRRCPKCHQIINRKNKGVCIPCYKKDGYVDKTK